MVCFCLWSGEQGEYVDSKGVDSNIGESGQSSKRAVDEKELSGHDEICSRTSDGCELRDSDSFNNSELYWYFSLVFIYIILLS